MGILRESALGNTVRKWSEDGAEEEVGERGMMWLQQRPQPNLWGALEWGLTAEGLTLSRGDWPLYLHINQTLGTGCSLKGAITLGDRFP